MSMLQTKTTVKTCVMKKGNDSIAFNLTEEYFQQVTYYFGTDWKEPYEETRNCNIKEAQERYERALRNGFKVVF